MRPHTPTRFPYTTLFRSRRPQLRPQRPVRQRSFSCERNESLRAAFNARHSFTIPTVVNSFQKFSLWERFTSNVRSRIRPPGRVRWSYRSFWWIPEAKFTWVPERVLERIGIRREKKDVRFVLANGQEVTRSVGFGIIRLDKYFTIDEVVIAEPGDLALLGARTLGGLNLTVESVRRRLVASGPPPAASPIRSEPSSRLRKFKRR